MVQSSHQTAGTVTNNILHWFMTAQACRAARYDRATFSLVGRAQTAQTLKECSQVFGIRFSKKFIRLTARDSFQATTQIENPFDIHILGLDISLT